VIDDSVTSVQSLHDPGTLGFVASIHDCVNDLPLHVFEGFNLAGNSFEHYYNVSALRGTDDPGFARGHSVDLFLETGIHAAAVDRPDDPVIGGAAGLGVLCN